MFIGSGIILGSGLNITGIVQPVQESYWLQTYGAIGAWDTEGFSIAANSTNSIYNAGVIIDNPNYDNEYGLLLKYDSTGSLIYNLIFKENNSTNFEMFDIFYDYVDSNNNVYLLFRTNINSWIYSILKLTNVNSTNPNDVTIGWIVNLGNNTTMSSSTMIIVSDKIICSGGSAYGSINTVILDTSGNFLLSRKVIPTGDQIYTSNINVTQNLDLIYTGYTIHYVSVEPPQVAYFYGSFIRTDSTCTNILNQVVFSKPGQLTSEVIIMDNAIVIYNNSVFLSFYTYNASTYPASSTISGILEFDYSTNSILWQKGFDFNTVNFNSGATSPSLVKDSNNNLIFGSSFNDINNVYYILIAKFDSTGNLLWQNILHNADNPDTYFANLSVDENNNIIVTGTLGYPGVAMTIKLPSDGSIPPTITAPWVYETSSIPLITTNYVGVNNITATTDNYDPGVLPTQSVSIYTYVPGTQPIADFTGTPFTGADPLTVSFTDLTTNNPTSWAWDFNNDGTVDSTLQNPSYTYTTAGTYSVKLTATNQAGSNTIIKTNYITSGYCAPYQVDYFPWATYVPNYNTTPNFLSNSVYNDPQYDGVSLNLNLGGYAPSWTGGASFVQLIYLFTYNNSYGVAGPEIGNDGYFSLWNQSDNFSITNSTVKTRYAALPQGTSPGAGHYVYPGVSSYDGAYAYITARNFGQPIVCELWYSLNQNRSNPTVGYSNYTFFGDQFNDVCPNLFFNNPSSYVKKYQVGILKATADMYNLTDSDFIAGISYVGGASGGTIKTIHNGNIITQRTYTGKSLVYIGGTGNMDFIASGYITDMGTAKSNVNRIAFDIGFSDNSTDSDYWGQWFVNDNPPSTTGLIDTYQVKWAWIIDCETNGLEEHSIDWAPGMCYTLPNVVLPCAPAGNVPNYTPPAPLV